METALDFSKLHSIAYRGIEGAEARAFKDQLIEQGCTIVEEQETPFTTAEAQPLNTSTKPQESPVKKPLPPFTGADKSRNYRAMYRAACNYHEAHNPPTIDREYWKTHTPGIDDTPEAELKYWEKAAEDLVAIDEPFKNDKFFIDLIVAIYSELEKEYKAMREEAASSIRAERA